jgi:SAM-dependent methyltransferase
MVFKQSDNINSQSIVSVMSAYRLILNRELDKGGRLTWSEIINKQEFSKNHVINTLLDSYEFKYLTKRQNKFAQYFKIKAILKLLSNEVKNTLQQASIVYRFLLYREIDASTQDAFMTAIADKKFSINKLIWRVIRSKEYDDPERNPPTSSQLHMARIKWVKTLPAAKRLLDIGGSSPTLAEGALIELGYAHRPDKLIIFDKPPNEQFWGKPNYSQDKDNILNWGDIQYMHGYAEDILSHAELQDQKFDIVFMGQVVEHIYEDKLHDVLVWIKNHLTEAGTLYFDTPNRLLTRLETGADKYIDPDHKKEYTPDEMKIIIEAAGFQMVEAWGIVDMPLSLKVNAFEHRDFYESQALTSNPHTAYCFAMACRAIGSYVPGCKSLL